MLFLLPLPIRKLEIEPSPPKKSLRPIRFSKTTMLSRFQKQQKTPRKSNPGLAGCASINKENETFISSIIFLCLVKVKVNFVRRRNSEFIIHFLTAILVLLCFDLVSEPSPAEHNVTRCDLHSCISEISSFRAFSFFSLVIRRRIVPKESY